MIAKWAIGFTHVHGCAHPGIASIGVSALDSTATGGFTKKPISCVLLADRASVEMNVPIQIPVSTQHAQAGPICSGREDEAW